MEQVLFPVSRRVWLVRPSAPIQPDKGRDGGSSNSEIADTKCRETALGQPAS